MSAFDLILIVLVVSLLSGMTRYSRFVLSISCPMLGNGISSLQAQGIFIVIEFGRYFHKRAKKYVLYHFKIYPSLVHTFLIQIQDCIIFT